LTPFFQESKIVRGIIAQFGTIAAIRHSILEVDAAMVTNRDFVYLEVGQRVDQELQVLLWASVVDESVEEREGYVRGEIRPSGYVIQGKGGGGSCLTYVSGIDLKGWAPAWMADGEGSGMPSRLARLRDGGGNLAPSNDEGSRQSDESDEEDAEGKEEEEKREEEDEEEEGGEGGDQVDEVSVNGGTVDSPRGSIEVRNPAISRPLKSHSDPACNCSL